MQIPGSMKMNLKMPDFAYIPGTCNIGKSEIRRRQLVAVLGLFFSISTLLTFDTVDAPTSIRLGISSSGTTLKFISKGIGVGLFIASLGILTCPFDIT